MKDKLISLGGRLAIVVAAHFAGGAQAGVIASWNFDTAWAVGTADTSGYGGGWIARANGNVGDWNGTRMDYESGAAYGRSGGVAKITNTGKDRINTGQDSNRFAGVRLLLLDGPGDPLSPGYAFREAFEASLNKAFNPFVQVDFWDDGSDVNAGLFTVAHRDSEAFNAGSGNRVATDTSDPNSIRGFQTLNSVVYGTSARVANVWRTLRMELGTDGEIDYFVDGVLIGTSTEKYDTLANGYNGALSLLVGTAGNVSGRSASMVFDNFQFGNRVEVPEPRTLALAGLAMAGLAASRRRRA